ncbi:helix-turn-helix domain-containing protein [Maribacter polysaccharolyticus]|uniref:helix-turn-helix domain-containing protein n=1 Tax=Maribacter polysaccharolyticus TaxID=3020831 RepID=UPI00237EF9E3|nr:helix-turn-helix domain-containing protein [Maribacter polysaccharolyticus]MDE3741668.1 helix-turn-helix domain-containing protein [Maribacter polysaccharolyticus]
MKKTIFTQIDFEELTKGIADALADRFGSNPKPESEEPEEELLTREEAAKFLKIDQSTLWHWTNKGRVTAYAIGSRRYYKKTELLTSLKPLK